MHLLADFSGLQSSLCLIRLECVVADFLSACACSNSSIDLRRILLSWKVKRQMNFSVRVFVMTRNGQDLALLDCRQLIQFGRMIMSQTNIEHQIRNGACCDEAVGGEYRQLS